jgi:hypothetical protein
LLLKKMGKFQLDALAPYDPSFLAGIQAQAYDTGLEPAWEEGRRRMREMTKSKCKSQATSQRMRNFSMGMDFSNESWRYILLPIYLASYRYGDKSYQVLINGQNGKIAGQRPVDWRKIALDRRGILPRADSGHFDRRFAEHGGGMGRNFRHCDDSGTLGAALVFAIVALLQARAMDDI